MVLYLDTETTGYYPGEICELSYIMQTKDGATAKNFFFSVEKMSLGAFNVHGFSKERLETLSGGRKFADFIDEIETDFKSADLVVTHNTAFDIMFLRTEFERAGRVLPIRETFCTMKNSVSLCKIARRGGGYKYPRLSELCSFLAIPDGLIAETTEKLFGVDAGYHDARFDTAAVYLAAGVGTSVSALFNKILVSL